MKIAIVLLSRGRPQMLHDCLLSLQSSTLYPDALRVYIGVDTDEPRDTYYDYGGYGFDVSFDWAERPINMHKRLNRLAARAVGNGADLVMVLNDDCLIEDKGWDQKLFLKVCNAYEKWPDGIFYLETQDNSIDKLKLPFDYAAFPVISAPAIQSAEIFMDETFPYHGADVVTARIYHDVQRYAVSSVKIRHLFHENTEMLSCRLNEKTAAEMIRGTFTPGNASLDDILTCDVSGPVERLRKQINRESEI